MVTETEPEWDAEDREIIAALLEYEADICPGCSLPYSETLARREGRDDEQLVSDWFAKNPTAKFLTRYFVCTGCAAQAKTQAKQEERDEKDRKAGVAVFPQSRLWQVIPRPKP